MQLNQINDNTNYDDFAGQVFDFGVGLFQIQQRFNDKDTDSGLLAMYQSWGLTGHDGLDLTKVSDDIIPCFVSGKVVFADWFQKMDWIEKDYFNGGGRIVLIHNQERGQIYAYFHLAEIHVNNDQQVNRGDTIGRQGGSGFSDNAFPSHLHFKILNCDSQLNIQDLNNGFFGGENPLPELVAELLNNYSLANNQLQPQQISQTVEIQTNNNQNQINQDDMLKAKLDELTKQLQTEYPNQYDNWGRAFGNNYKASSGEEPLVWIKEMIDQTNWRINAKQVDIDTINAKYHTILAERNTLFDENASLKKNSQEQNQALQNQNQNQGLGENQALQQSQTVQNQQQVQEKTNEIQALSTDLKTAEINSKKSFLKENKGGVVAGGGALATLGLGSLEPLLNQFANFKPMFLNIIDSLRWWHLGVAIVVLGIAFMYRSKIQREIEKALASN
jgi:hypothetical protein